MGHLKTLGINTEMGSPGAQVKPNWLTQPAGVQILPAFSELWCSEQDVAKSRRPTIELQQDHTSSVLHRSMVCGGSPHKSIADLRIDCAHATTGWAFECALLAFMVR